jgi:alkylation response protein AidB-like acyl-CoA dehydrogenase
MTDPVRPEGRVTQFADTEDERYLREAVRSAMASINPLAGARALADDPRGFAMAEWLRLATELGLAGLLVPEDCGGAGAPLSMAGVVLEECGRFLYGGPVLSSAVMAPLLLLACDGDVSDICRRIADGSLVAVAGLRCGPPAEWQPRVRATLTWGGWRLNGAAGRVLHGTSADQLLVVGASDDGGWGVWLADSAAPGHAAVAMRSFDLTRRWSEHSFAGTPARLVMTPGDGAGIARAALYATVALSAEQVGASREIFARTLDHLRNRFQFGRAIGSFQALKHRCADMSVLVEGAISASRNALCTASAGEEDTELAKAAAVAGSHCSETFVRIASDALQLHGGLGMAWEHDCHLYLRRAKDTESFLGSPAEHRRLLMQALTGAPLTS